MRTAIALSAVVGLAAALPQGIDFVSVEAVPMPTVQGPPATGLSQAPTYNPTQAASSAAAEATVNPVSDATKKRRGAVDARSACASQPDGYGPTSSPDTADTFKSDSQYSSMAQSAVTPDGYSLSFSALNGATESPSYLGYYTMQSYDTIKCAHYCDAVSTCYFFNVFMERDPSVEPAAACPNPPSITNYKCSLFGAQMSDTTATNVGQWRQDFHVVIAGSNGYSSKSPPSTQTNFTGPAGRLAGAINAPLRSDGYDTYIGMRLFAGPYDPSQCAAVCQSTTQFDSQHPASDGTYKPCNFFNSYVLSKNGSPQGTYCSFYTQVWDKSYATNTGQYDGQGNYYSVSQSYTYTLTAQDSGVVAH